MRLDRLLAGIEGAEVRGDAAATEIVAITHDSRSTPPGGLYFCFRGSSGDGHDHASSAVAAGAAALVVEHPLEIDVPQVVVADSRRVIGPIASTFHGDPSSDVRVVGVTGTNGKTTTTQFLGAVLNHAGIATRVFGNLTPGPLNTPEAPEVQSRLAAARDDGISVVAMEVSSHALAQFRVDATMFEVGVFTNLTRDHLDFHPDMEDYFLAKARLFAPERCRSAVVNTDDHYGARLLGSLTVPGRTYALADANSLELGPWASRFSWRGAPVTLHMPGRFNVANALAAATAASELGVDPTAVAEGLSSVSGVPGHYETIVAEEGGFTVVVDYAHTPDGLDQSLLAAQAAAACEGGRVIVVFGCGGERDADKRPLMGAVAGRRADRVVLTSDNPRHEDPDQIIKAIASGLDPDDDYEVEPDRRRAIAQALAGAGRGDVVVVAGKGHETGQMVGGETFAFDDRDVVAQVLAR